ncbi:MAG: GGDEF domain-containing protein [Terracidiphilus sp.]
MNLVNWTRIPDFACMVLMIWAFASVTRHTRSNVAKIWLTGWLMILVYSIAALFTQIPGIWGGLAHIVFAVSLVWAGLLFTYASIPYRDTSSSRWLLAMLFASSTLYMTILLVSPGRHWALNLAALLLGLGPLAVTLASMHSVNDRLRWFVVSFCGALSIFLLIVQNSHSYGHVLAGNAVLFSVYAGNCFFAALTYRRATAGAFVAIFGFLGWALVFIAEPLLPAVWPQVVIESEVWHLPAFVVAIGMMLLLLEDQIAHNKHLALHDALTGLPNRRLFEDRMASALERSRRTGTTMALLVIDLNDFKQINDTMGHHVGDIVLQRVASAFADRVRRSDTVSRTGGDEFSVILEEPTNRDEAVQVGRSLQQLLHDPLEIEDRKVNVGVSVGIAIFPEDGSDAESLYVAADLKMYGAKRRSQESRQGASAS